MRDVFEGASSTTVWLGLSTVGECESAMKFLAHIGSDGDLHLDPLLVPYVEVEGMNILSSQIIAGLKSLFGSSWWSRVWTVQEWFLSRHAVFQSGPLLIEGLNVQRALDHWNSHMYDQACCYGFLVGHPKGRDLFAHFDKLFYLTQDTVGSSLPYTISLFRDNCVVTDPRDKGYGILSLARGQYENAVDADYTQTIEAAFQATTIQMIRQTGSLEVLSHIPGAVDPELALPSYVTD
ncbi:uncharacterized protein EKO05_0001728 [Ascochyta rabiei]|nr:uncharacterized protein EKO05_0001728 [Ascochyta rabiei]UPX11105.1 hypothetical protein EKO05_0001728 [Ascochyta rabiei]